MSLTELQTDFSDELNLIGNERFQALAITLNQAVSIFKDVVKEHLKVQAQAEYLRIQHLSQKEICNSKKCTSSTDLQQIITAKDNLIQFIGSSLTKVKERKDLSLLDDVLKSMCIDVTALTPPCDGNDSVTKTPQRREEDYSMRESSMSEIEGTPTGCVSPILGSKKSKVINKSESFRQKCSNFRPATQETKVVNLTFATPSKSQSRNGKMKQTRLKVSAMRAENVVDLTCSPEYGGGSRVVSSDPCRTLKKEVESMDYEDAILPTPTCDRTKLEFPSLYKSFIKSKNRGSPNKFKRPLLSKLNVQKDGKHDMESNENDQPSKVSVFEDNQAEDSINLLQQHNIGPKKSPTVETKVQDVLSQFDNNESISLLQRVDNTNVKSVGRSSNSTSPSPPKFPLIENTNATNVPDKVTEEHKKLVKKEPSVKYEPKYKEPAPRTKADKRAMPGWSCEECKSFYSALYKDEEGTRRRLVTECSRHRARRDPTRPGTPPGFWNPRWDVPSDTEAFNRGNNAL